MNKKIFLSRFAAIFTVLTLVLAVVQATSIAAKASSLAVTGPICDQYGTTTQGSYVVMNNRWGTTATQCINVTTNGFAITQQDGVGNLGGAPVSYPAIYVGCHYSNCSPGTNLPMQVSAINTANTSVTLTYPSGSHTYDAAYDIWLNPTTNVSGVQASEIMIWLNRVGSIQPIGSYSTTVSLAGRSWEVWTGNNGANNVVSYVTTGVTSFNADVKLFIVDSFTRMSGFGNTSWYLTSAQMGFEPWIGGVGLAVNSFSLSVVGGGGGPTPTRTNTPLPGPTLTPTRTNTPSGPTPTFTRTPTPGSGGGTCSPVTSTITAPFDKTGAGTFCYQSSNMGTNINSWGMTTLTVNGTNYTNLWVSTSSLPAKIGGFWYVVYVGTGTNSHFVGTP